MNQRKSSAIELIAGPRQSVSFIRDWHQATPHVTHYSRMAYLSE